MRKIVDVYSTLKTAKLKNDALKEVIDHISYLKETKGHGHEEEFEIKVFPKLPRSY